MILKIKISHCLLLLFVIFTGVNNPAFSQSFTTPIGWHHTLYEARVVALGQSTAALDNGSSYSFNPAVLSEAGSLNVSSFLFSTIAFDAPGDGADLYSPAVSFSNGKTSYSVMVDYTSFSTPSEFGSEGSNYSNRLLRMQAGYQITDILSVGAGVLHSSYKSPIFSFNNNEFGGDAAAWGIDFGLFYQNLYESDKLLFKPQAGLSLNTIGPGFEYELSSMPDDNLPGQIRLGIGLDIVSKRKVLNEPLFGLGIYSGFSKYLARLELVDDGTELSRPGGFEALFTTWNSFERFTGSQNEVISLGEQISGSVGFELQFLETLYLRYGILTGADNWVRPQNAIGTALDLYYFSFAVSQVNYHSSDEWGPQDNLTHVQVSFRIPIDGWPRDTLIGKLFD